MRTKVLLALVLGFLAPVTRVAFAQTHPNDARGLNANSSQAFGPDTVNLFNGNLTIAIPLGPAVPVNGGFSYGLTLVYNSQLWEYNSYTNSSNITLTQSLPDRANNAGLGWRVSLGRYNPPQYPDQIVLDPVATGYPALVPYDSPDGGRHLLYDRLHESDNNQETGTKYTRDGSYLRFKSSQVQFPDGSSQTVGSQGFPSALRDAFGNTVNIRYLNAGGAVVNPAQAVHWEIRNPNNALRTTDVWLKQTVAPYLANQPLLIDRVDVSSSNGDTATYKFHYNIDTDSPDTTPVTVTGCKNTDPSTNTVSVVLLTSVDLPDQTTYRMPRSDYFTTTATADPCTTGLLKRVGLPTLGKVEWDYGVYGFNPNSSPHAFRQIATGVTARRLIGATGPLAGDWQITPTNPTPYERITDVRDPNNTTWRHYFSMCPGGCPQAEQAFDYGLPLTHTTSVPHGPPDDGAGRFLSLEVIEAGTTVRTLYVKYDHDPSSVSTGGSDDLQYFTRLNQRLASRRVLYGAPQQNPTPTADYADDVYSSFDGLGHYRVHTTGGNFPGPDASSANNNTKTWTVDYNASTGSYPGTYTPWPTASPWMLSGHTFSQVQEGALGQMPYESVCIDASTGFLRGRRTHVQSGPGYSANDLVAVFEQTGGNVMKESYLGGDGGGLPTDATNGAICHIADALVSSPGSLPTPRYQLTHEYSWGLRNTSRYTGFTFKVLDRTIDQRTGLTTSERDSALRQTTYTYDGAHRRLTTVTPSGESAVDYTYRNPAGSDLLRVTTSKGSVAVPPGPITRETFDLFGRTTELETKEAGGTSYSSRRTLYNSLGWKTFIGEQGGAAQFGTTIVSFDPFGRPRTIRPADGSSHDVTVVYAGDKQVTRTTKVATAVGPETNAVTVETYDRFGRLFEVTEPNGKFTRYTYDAADRLRTVCQNRTGSTCGQTRTFNYDNRGFLTSEQHPEASVTYGAYDARGHALQKQDGVHDLTFVYDDAERLTEVKETGGATLKSLTYASATGAGDWQQVKTASRANIVPSYGTTTITETNTYAGVHGRISQRLTTVSTGESFTQSFGFDASGQLSTLGYPTCTHAGCTQPTAAIFADVPIGYPNRLEIEALYRAGVTAGCSSNPLNFCPTANVTRAEMAVFLVLAATPGFTPPACTTATFADVPCSYWAAPWVEELYRRGMTSGCGGGNYCPGNNVGKAELSVWMIRAKEGLSYTPPACTVAPFNDVPCSYWGAPWIAEAVRRGYIEDCGGNNFCPETPPATRAQIAVWFDRAYDYPVATDANTVRTVALGHNYGFLTSVTDTAPNPDVTYGTISYQPNLTINQIVRNNGTTDTIGLDASYLPRPASIGTAGSYASWSSGAYAYDGTGNTKAIGSSSFLYDNLSRIGSATVFTGQTGGGSSIQKTFTYDVYGNLLSGAGPANNAVDPATNRLQSPPNTYDGAGNLTVWNLGPTYGYDSFNQMTRMTNGSQNWLYLYNANDERVLARDLTAGVSRWSLRDLGGLTLREYLNDNGRWSVGNDYFYRDGLLLAAETPAGRRHFHLDHLGSPRLITRASGYQSAYHAYFPFGMEATGETQDSVRMKFTGHERDLANLTSSADDLDYMHARHYNPLLGRFLSPDLVTGSPRRPQSWNLYSYVSNRPLTFADPMGLYAVVSSPPPAGMTPDEVSTDVTAAEGITVCSGGGAWRFAPGPNTGLQGVRSLSQGRGLLDSLHGYYEDRFERMAAEGNYLAAGVDYTGLLMMPESSAEAGLYVALAFVPGPLDESLAGTLRIKGFTKHGINQAISRDGVGVSVEAILDTIRNPVKLKPQARGAMMVIGKEAVVILSEAGKVITTWARSSSAWRWVGGGM